MLRLNSTGSVNNLRLCRISAWQIEWVLYSKKLISVEHWAGIAEVMGPVEYRSGLNFFQALILQLFRLCVQLRWSIINSYFIPEFKYMIFHISICLQRLLRVFYELAKWSAQPAPKWLDSSVGRALHRYSRRHGSNPVKAWIFFKV